MHTPTLQRIRRRPVAPATTTLLVPGGAVGLDMGGVFEQLLLRELLKGTGARGRI